MALEDFLNQTATITVEAPTGVRPAQTAMGGADRTARLTAVSGVPCLVRPTGASLSAFGTARDGARRNVATHRIYFSLAAETTPPLEELSSRHQIEVEGRVYAVTSAIDVNSHGRLLQVDCEMIR